MISAGISLATKGILGDSIASKGFVLLSIREVPLKRRTGGAVSNGNVGIQKNKIIKIVFSYNGKIYQQSKVVGKNIKVGINDINIKVINNTPKIFLKIK